MTVEEWRWIPGHEGYYKVSNQGRAMSYFDNRGPRPEPLLLSPWADEHGYRQLTLSHYKGGRRKLFLHNAVLMAFVGPRPSNCPHTRHLDNNPANNELSNLAYGTAAENGADRIRHAVHLVKRTHCEAGHPLSGDNLLRRGDGGRRCRTCSIAYHRARRAAAALARSA